MSFKINVSYRFEGEEIVKSPDYHAQDFEHLEELVLSETGEALTSFEEQPEIQKLVIVIERS